MLLLFSHLLIVAACLIGRVFGLPDDIVGLIFVIASSFAVLFYIISLVNVDKKMRFLLLFAFFVRIILIAIDVFVVRLVDAGTDDDGFYKASINIYSNDYANISENVYGGFFPKLLSVAYYAIGSSRFSAQYLNALFYVISSILFLKTLIYFNVSERVLWINMLIFCLLPNALLNNSVLRRETAMGLCVCTSLFYLSKWRNDKRISYVFFSIIFLALSSLFHTALIIGVPILAVFFALYDKKKGKVSFSISKMSKMIVVLVCVIGAGIAFLSLWQNKFSSVSSMDDVYVATNRARGGSVYLEGYEVNNVGQLIIFTPLKLFYFLFSPMPWKFRGIMDIISFLFDAAIYLFLLIKVIRAPKDSFAKLTLTMFIVLSIVFALGTNNSGTAIRHRLSLLPFLLTCYSIAETVRERNKRIAGLGEEKDV